MLWIPKIVYLEDEAQVVKSLKELPIGKVRVMDKETMILLRDIQIKTGFILRFFSQSLRLSFVKELEIEHEILLKILFILKRN